MRTFAKKSVKKVANKVVLGFFVVIFAFSPIATTIKPAQASFLSDMGGDLAVTALGCSGLLDKATSALSQLTSSLLGQATGEVPVADNSANTKESCLDAIAYTAAKIVLSKITQSTLNWINSGFDGSPTFVQDPGSFFKSIADQQVSSFTAQIAFDPSRFPFGRLTAQNIVNSIQHQLDYNASVTSGNLLNYDGDMSITYQQRFDNFTNDFLYGGGWDGYLAVTQITNANPFDSYIASVNQVGPAVNAAAQQKNPVTQVTNELEQSGGFLALKKCVDPTWYTSERSDPSFTRVQAEAQSKNDPTDPDTQAAREWLVNHTCLRFETKTPGTAIAQQMNISLGESQKQLELADELNESISAVFDALIKQLFNKGVASLSGEDTAGSNVNVLGGYGNNTADSTITSGGGTGTGTSGTQWYQQNQNFDLKEAIAPGGTIDDADCRLAYNAHGDIANPNAVTSAACNQGLAVLQKAYADALRAENIKLTETIRWINYADYCVPGPRPDWYQTAVAAVSALQERFSEIGAKTDDTKRAHDSYLELKYFTGFAADYYDETNLENPSHAYNAIWQTLREAIGGPGYKEYIEDRYDANDPHMPLSATLINQEYLRKSHYQSIITENISAATEADGMALRLSNIYANIQQGEAQFGVGTPTEQTAAFKQFMDNQLKIFSRLVSQIKTPEIIDNVIADVSLANDEIKYLADPTTGLIKSCIDETTRPLNASGVANPSYLPSTSPRLTRRAYGEQKANVADFIFMNWPGGIDPLASYTNAQSFLPDVTITAQQDPTTGAVIPSPGIYIGHYVNQCRAILLGGSATYFGCGDGDSLTISPGDRFESHINAY